MKVNVTLVNNILESGEYETLPIVLPHTPPHTLYVDAALLHGNDILAKAGSNGSHYNRLWETH